LKVGDILRATTRAFRAAQLHYGHGTMNARDEAAWLVGHVLQIHPGDVGLHAQRPVTLREEKRIRALAQKRTRQRTPLAYLLQEAWLDGRRFHVDRRVIVPRSFISELLRERLRPWFHRPVRRALDLCTGSGCLAVLLALAFPRAQIDAADIAAPALQVARINVARYRLQKRIRLVRSDLFDALKDETYDVIVTNPPYVDARTMRTLPREYRYEPRLALAAGQDGLDAARHILAQARRHLTPSGLLVCEVGDARRALERAFPRLPFLWPETSDPAGCVFLLEREQLPV
jgi:ribosomal protein L3 glutamine methyltransferase